MKTFAIALAIVGLGVVSATAETLVVGNDHEGQNYEAVAARPATIREVPAGRVLANEDLVNENMTASELVRVTSFPSSGAIDTGQ